MERPVVVAVGEQLRHRQADAAQEDLTTTGRLAVHQSLRLEEDAGVLHEEPGAAVGAVGGGGPLGVPAGAAAADEVGPAVGVAGGGVLEGQLQERKGKLKNFVCLHLCFISIVLTGWWLVLFIRQTLM